MSPQITNTQRNRRTTRSVLNSVEAEHTAWMPVLNLPHHCREGHHLHRLHTPRIVEHDACCIGVESFKFPWAIAGPFAPVSIPGGRLTKNALNRPACPLAFPQPRIGEHGPVAVGLDEIGETEVDPAQDGLAEVGLAQVCPPQVCPAQVDGTQVDLAEVGGAEVCAAEVCLAEVCPTEVGLAEDGPDADGPAEEGVA